MGSIGRQKGVALMTAMLVVALATVAATALATRLQLDVRRSGNVIHGDQALLYARGVEAWSGQILRRDQENGNVDHLGEDWATVLPPMTVEGGQLAGYLEDMQGRFNLNNLLNAEGKPSTLDITRFQRLLIGLELSPDLADAVVDWMDADVDPRFPGGAEDSTYSAQQPGYRAANRPMAHPSELLLVAGFDAEAYRKLAPFVAALPERTPLNLNTAPAAVLQVVADGLGIEGGKVLVEARGETGFESVEQALANDALSGLPHDEGETEGLAVSSRYFLVHATIAVGRLQMGFYSLLARNGSGMGVPVERGFGVY